MATDIPDYSGYETGQAEAGSNELAALSSLAEQQLNQTITGTPRTCLGEL